MVTLVYKPLTKLLHIDDAYKRDYFQDWLFLIQAFRSISVKRRILKTRVCKPWPSWLFFAIRVTVFDEKFLSFFD